MPVQVKVENVPVAEPRAAVNKKLNVRLQGGGPPEESTLSPGETRTYTIEAGREIRISEGGADAGS